MLQEFKDIYTDRYRFIKEQEEQGKKVMGWVCTYVPEEIITRVNRHIAAQEIIVTL